MSEIQRGACESLIETAMIDGGLTREHAIIALGIRDMKRLQQGHSTQVDGVDFQTGISSELSEVYPSIHEDDVAKLTAYLENVSIEEAKRRTKERMSSGLWAPIQKH